MRVSPAPWGNLRRLKSVPRGVGHAAFKRLVGLERAYTHGGALRSTPRYMPRRPVSVESNLYASR